MPVSPVPNKFRPSERELNNRAREDSGVDLECDNPLFRQKITSCGASDIALEARKEGLIDNHHTLAPAALGGLYTFGSTL